MSHPAKRQRIDNGPRVDPATVRQQRAAFLASIQRGISPPPSARGTPEPSNSIRADSSADSSANLKNAELSIAPETVKREVRATNTDTCKIISSPFKLTTIRDLPAESNIDTLSLHDILGNPLIKSAWIFNFCFDVDWMMQHFDVDIRSMVQVNIIHGSWRKEDGNKIGIDNACMQWPNVAAATAYLPDPFGTHHSKMFVLFTHDDHAEVIIHTANMLPKDWTNMTQGVWRSGPLPKTGATDTGLGEIGSGARFKYDLLEYLKSYKKPTQALVKDLQHYSFDNVRGALVASVPAKIDNTSTGSTRDLHLWGYPQLREVTAHVKKVQQRPSGERRHLVAQVSSIATLPAGWLQNLIHAFNAPTPNVAAKASTDLSIIYPTAPNVAQSLDGYAAGGSIHTKAKSAAHLKQIEALRPHLCQWTQGFLKRQYSALRSAAAPHIKTYIQFNQKPTEESLGSGKIEIEWALLTSANLSTQAWGSLPKVDGDRNARKRDEEKGIVQIQSFEIGVLVWPELYIESASPHQSTASRKDDDGKERRVRMVPVFGKDEPDLRSAQILSDVSSDVVGLRIPYDLPLTPYGPAELPWSPGGTYHTPDSQGRAWV